MLDIGLVVRKLAAELPRDLIDLVLVLYNFNAAKDNDAADVQSPFAVLPKAAVIRTVGRLIMTLNSVNFVSLFSAVEVKPAVLVTVKVILDGITDCK